MLTLNRQAYPAEPALLSTTGYSLRLCLFPPAALDSSPPWQTACPRVSCQGSEAPSTQCLGSHLEAAIDRMPLRARIRWDGIMPVLHTRHVIHPWRREPLC